MEISPCQLGCELKRDFFDFDGAPRRPVTDMHAHRQVSASDPLKSRIFGFAIRRRTAEAYGLAKVPLSQGAKTPALVINVSRNSHSN